MLGYLVIGLVFAVLAAYRFGHEEGRHRRPRNDDLVVLLGSVTVLLFWPVFITAIVWNAVVRGR